MDPISLTLGIAGVLPLIANAIQSARGYVNAVIGAKKSIADMITELEALKSNMDSLKELVDGDALRDSDVRFGQTSALTSCCTACKAKLRALCDKLDQEGSAGRLSRYITWPLTEREHQKTLQEIRNFTSWLRFALSVDGCKLLAQTADDVTTILAQQLQAFSEIQNLANRTAQLHETMEEQKTLLEKSAERENRRDILDWISTKSFHQKQHALQNSRTKNTGGWLLSNKEYFAWRDGLATSNLLWCSGIQGSGKTNLASIVIDELVANNSSSTTLTAFYYFDHQDQSCHTSFALVSRILRQLLEALPEIPKSVIDLHHRSGDAGPPPSHECERLIIDIVQNSTSTHLVIDALDECQGTELLQHTLNLIDRLLETKTCHILVTSRPHIHGITCALQDYPQVKIEAHDEDLRTYLRQELHSARIYEMADDQFVKELVEILCRGAEGMFLLPVLQLRTILKEPTLGEMEDRLQNLSHSLNAAFEETISRIQRLPESRSRLGMVALMYLTHARRLMTVEELSDALALQQGRNIMNVKYRPSGNVILECCQGLAVLDPATGCIRLAHYAIHEYLINRSEDLFPRHQEIMAQNCLKYLLLEDFKDGPLMTEEEIEKRLDRYPYLTYAAAFWGKHVRTTETDAEVWLLLRKFFSSRPATATAVQTWRYYLGYRKIYYSIAESRSVTPLHHACQHGLENAVRVFLDQKLYAVDERTRMGTTPIINAASDGHVSIVRLLLERNADPRLSNWYGNALQCAAEAGECGTIRELVTWGMHPDEHSEGRVPLCCSLDHDRVEAFETLVDLGADPRIHMQDNEEDNIWYSACRWGCDKVVRLMLQRGWIDLNSRVGRLGVHHAVMAVDTSALRRIVAGGANLEVLDDNGHTPLWIALHVGSHAAASFLVEAGAEHGRDDDDIQATKLWSLK